MRKSRSGSKNWHLKVGGKSPGEEVGLAGPGQRTEVLGSRAEARLVGRWGGLHRAGLHQGLQSFKGNTFNSENRVLGRPRFSEKHNPT